LQEALSAIEVLKILVRVYVGLFLLTSSTVCMEEGRGVYRIPFGRSEGKRPLGRPRNRWEVNIKMDLREIGIDGANWIRLAQDTVR
jgi:hypothetical protein